MKRCFAGGAMIATILPAPTAAGRSTRTTPTTRMATQGSELVNINNHPFPGMAGQTHFSLAHNGVLTNDKTLRKKYKLPATKVETDSYVAVQLLEQ